VVAGAGLAGLAAARELERDGASVIVMEARDRVGGRVHTIRQGFAGGQHAEAGADLIEGEQVGVRELASSLGLELAPILKTGWGFHGGHASRSATPRAPDIFERAATRLAAEIRDYEMADRRWDSAVAAALGRTSVAAWLRSIRADREFEAAMRGLRGFFLADPEDLSLLVLVDQFSSGGTPGEGRMFRIRGGNDRLPEAMSAALQGTLLLNTVVRRVRQRRLDLVIGAEEHGRLRQIRADYCVLALPATTLRAVRVVPALEPPRREAIERLQYGPATRALLQFARPFWRVRRRPRAFGTDLPVGAVWDGTEDQRGPRAVLSLLAGGRASSELQNLVAREGVRGLLRRLSWLGRPAPVLASHVISWERDGWSGGGYAVFDPGFDPVLRSWLARPAGRVCFAGEHTSDRWQGYMNGAIESGCRAAAEIRALVRESHR
jgi:monoamine oxidase